MTPRAPRPTPSARRPMPRLRSSGSRPAWPRWTRGSRRCMRTSSDMRSSAFASTSGWAGSARSWSTSRRSRRRRGSSECGGRWMRRRSKRGSAPHANGPGAPRRRSRKHAVNPRRSPKRWARWSTTRRPSPRSGPSGRTSSRSAASRSWPWRVPPERPGSRSRRRTRASPGRMRRSRIRARRWTPVARRSTNSSSSAPRSWAAGDLEWLRQEDERLRAAIDAVGPVNALAVDEHGEEVKRLEFLMTQRDDLVAARQSLQQAAREIDQTAKAMFLDSFGKVRENFRTVFQTLFGGGECDVRLANEDEPLESEIEIHAAPRGKRTQRIHLLSSGERTLVAVSLLFAIFLAKPSPFCLLDEVDAPLDDANVGRYVRLLAEFKDQTQFIVITHNPRTMQAADAVYGVTMQEPGVSTIVGVRLGQMEPV